MEIVDNTAESRFVLDAGGVTAELVYRTRADRLVLVHTGVPDEMSGRGIGGKLVLAALDKARAEGLTIVPQCPYARKWLEDHPDAIEGVTIDWTEQPATS